jgi:hypothetical protein
MKKILFSIFVLIVLINSPFLFAETCPTIDQIKQGLIGGWVLQKQVFCASPANSMEMKEFKHSVTEFAGVIYVWSPYNKSGCYYKTTDGVSNYQLCKITQSPVAELPWMCHFPSCTCKSSNPYDCFFHEGRIVQ